MISDLLPRLLVVTGRPGSGKTTLAHALARAIRCPAICRDEVKEGLVHTLPPDTPADQAQRQANAAFFATLELLARHGITHVAEAAFQHKLWAPALEPLGALARIRLIVCQIDPLLARDRHIARGLADPARERFHGDPAVAAARAGEILPPTDYTPPLLDTPTLIVDTTNGYAPPLETIAAFAND